MVVLVPPQSREAGSGDASTVEAEGQAKAAVLREAAAVGGRGFACGAVGAGLAPVARNEPVGGLLSEHRR